MITFTFLGLSPNHLIIPNSVGRIVVLLYSKEGSSNRIYHQILKLYIIFYIYDIYVYYNEIILSERHKQNDSTKQEQLELW